MDIVTYVQATVETMLAHIARPETQTIVAYHQPTYTMYTASSAGAGQEAILTNTKILTPYAGDGFGMVCLPRSGANVVTMPIRNKIGASVAVGRYYIDSERVPPHDAGDFLIKHETQSELLFRISQPPMLVDGSYSGDKTIVQTDPDEASRLSKSFVVTLSPDAINSGAMPLRNGDLVFITYKAGAQATDMRNTVTDTERFRYMWLVPLVKRKKGTEDEFVITISSSNITSVASLVDYSAKDLTDDRFTSYRILPTKGFVHLRHYTNSCLRFDEHPDYTILNTKLEQQSVRGNMCSVLAPDSFIIAKDKDTGQDVAKPAFEKTPKGRMWLRHHSMSGLDISETESQVRASGMSSILSLVKAQPMTNDYLPFEGISKPFASIELIMRDITQDGRDVGTFGGFRHLTSASIADESSEYEVETELILQKEDGHFGIDVKHPESVELTGSNWFVTDYLRQYDADKGGWRFVSEAEARKQYEENDTKYRASDALVKGYDIDIAKRIVPASGRRDVLLRQVDRKGSEQTQPGEPDYKKVRGINFLEAVENGNWEVLKGEFERQDGEKNGNGKNDDNKELIGQKGYTYNTQSTGSPVADKSFEDGYLCFPKGAVGFQHYTRSGLEVRELEPNLDYHALQMSLSLYNWDMGSYYQPHHTFDKKHDFSKMKFGPYPMPMAQLVMEHAKFITGNDGRVHVPTASNICHTIHPQPDLDLKAGDESKRTTLATGGETGSWVGLYQYTSQIQSVKSSVSADSGRLGSRLLFRDYVIHAQPTDPKTPLIAASKWWNIRGEIHDLIAPKGALELHNYTDSGLAIYDQRAHYLNKLGGGHAMGMELVLRSLDFMKVTEESANDQVSDVVPLCEKPDGMFYCKITSNELVDKGDNYTYKAPKEHQPPKEKCRYWAEDDEGRPTTRAKAKTEREVHGKRGSNIGITHDTTRARGYDKPAHFWFEDYIIQINGDEGDELSNTLQPSHLYKKKEAGQSRVLLMPRGLCGLEQYNLSGFWMGDAVKDDTIDPEEESETLERGKAQLAYYKLALQEWNNQKIDDEEKTYAKPFADPSITMVMEAVADGANYEGLDATRFLLHQHSNAGRGAVDASRIIMEDFIRPSQITLKDRTLNTASHIYNPDEKEQQTPAHKKPMFPKGMLGIQLYNDSGLILQDLERNQGAEDEPKRQRASLALDLNEWNNRKCPEVRCKAMPLDKPSIRMSMEELCAEAVYNGEQGMRFATEVYSQRTLACDKGSNIVFEDYLDADMPAGIYDTEKDETQIKDLLFPKGRIGVHHYTDSGLEIVDLERKKELGKQRICVQLTMREWDNSGDGKAAKPFEEDSTILEMREKLPDVTAQGKRVSRVLLEALTSKSAGATYGSHLNIEDFVTGNEPSHIYEGGGQGLQKPKFPKGKVELLHYTESGIVLEDKQTTNDGGLHQPSVQMRLRQWGESTPEGQDLAQIYAWDEQTQKEQVAIHVGFLHNKTQSRCYIKDLNVDKDNHKMECGLSHWTTSYLKFEDLTHQDNRQVKIQLYHMKDSYLLLNQKNESPGDMLVDLHHTKQTGYKVDNNSDQVTLTIYHVRGSTVVIDPDGNVTVNSVRDINAIATGNITANAGQSINASAGSSATVSAPSITLNGNVSINGSLNVSGGVVASSYNNTAGNLV